MLQLHMSWAAPRRNQEANTSSVCCCAKPSSCLFPPRQLEFFYKVQLCFTSQQIKIFLPGLFCLTSASMVFLRRISILLAVVLLLQTFSRTPITVPRMKRSLSVTGPARPAGQQHCLTSWLRTGFRKDLQDAAQSLTPAFERQKKLLKATKPHLPNAEITLTLLQ